VKILDDMVRNDARTRELVEEATVNALVAKLIYDARIKARLTQKQLAELAGTQQPVIARLEDADYEGHSLMMLQRIAKALNRRVEIRLAKCA
jgi:transcriptional regulator with XRE-family HTH domain